MRCTQIHTWTLESVCYTFAQVDNYNVDKTIWRNTANLVYNLTVYVFANGKGVSILCCDRKCIDSGFP